MLDVNQLRQVSSYYRDLLMAISHHTGKHLVDLGSSLRHGLTTDLGLFVNNIEKLIEQEIIVFDVDRVSPNMISNILVQ